jgi:hypothetical protein
MHSRLPLATRDCFLMPRSLKRKSRRDLPTANASLQEILIRD